MPSPRKVARLRCVAGWSHMRTFIAGAISTRVSVANNRVEARSFATPLAILAIRSAVAGATTTKSATRLSWICPISASSPRSNKSRYSFCPANAETDKGVTNSSPARVSTGVTVAPRSRRRRIRSRDLKAAMPPPIISRICLPASMIAPSSVFVPTIGGRFIFRQPVPAAVRADRGIISGGSHQEVAHFGGLCLKRFAHLAKGRGL